MPRFELRNLNQKVLYWEKTGADDYGRSTVAAKKEIVATWGEYLREGQGPQDRNISRETILVTDQDLVVGSAIYLGSLEDYRTGSADPDYLEVVDFRIAYDIKGRHPRRESTLRRFANELPSLT